MTKSVILEKLRRELQVGITSESQVVYILVEIRKAIEQAGEQMKYCALDFYCSWALHTKMDRAGAVKILKRFRCQPTTVSALTISNASRQLGQIRESTTQNPRSFLLSLGTPLLLLSTLNCCRKARFSRARSRRSLKAATIRIPSPRSVAIMGGSVQATG